MKSGSAKLLVFFFLLFLISSSVPMAFGYRVSEKGRGGDDEESRGGGEGGERFLLPRSKQVMRTEAGEFRVVRSYMGKGIETPMHIGFINMEPQTLFLPQYLDSTLIIFLRRGEAKIGWINKDGLVEQQLKIGDVYTIPAGSTFYIVNTGEGQRLQMICSIDMSDSLKMGVFQSFFIGGGMFPVSILAGFGEKTLTTAFNVSSSLIGDILTRQQAGPIVYVNGTHGPSEWASFMQLKHQERRYDVEDEDDEDNNQEEQSSWTWRKFLGFTVGENGGNKSKKSKSVDAYNIFNRKPDYENNYGSSIAIDENDYAALRDSDVGVYFVYLTAGAMMAPHVNSMAAEIGIVLKGSGRVQIVYPNGSSAMDAVVNEGDAFWIPKYFPFCQIASRDGPMLFFGFTTSARDNRPQFLAGASSILQTIKGPELAMAFGVTEEELDEFINAQNESVILPTTPAAPPQQRQEGKGKGKGKEKEKEKERVVQVIRELWE